MKASACHHVLHTNHWHYLWKIPPIIAVKSNVSTFIQVFRLIANMFYCGRVAFTVFKHADIKGVRQRLTSTASLMNDRYCEALRDTTWRNNGRSAWNGPRFDHICAFYVEITNIHTVKLKMSCYNREMRPKSFQPVRELYAFQRKIILFPVTGSQETLSHSAILKRLTW